MSIPIDYDSKIYLMIINTLAFSLLFPEGIGLLQFDLLLNFGFFVELVEIVHNDGDGQGDAEHPTDRTNLTESH